MLDFLVSYYFDLKRKEIHTLLPYIELAFSKFFKEGTYTEVWMYENYIPSIHLTYKTSLRPCPGG